MINFQALTVTKNTDYSSSSHALIYIQKPLKLFLLTEKSNRMITREKIVNNSKFIFVVLKFRSDITIQFVMMNLLPINTRGEHWQKNSYSYDLTHRKILL